MAVKNGSLLNFRQNDFIEKTFDTEFYNIDIHQSSQILPEFLRLALK